MPGRRQAHLRCKQTALTDAEEIRSHGVLLVTVKCIYGSRGESEARSLHKGMEAD